jgi:hypothetical protein
MSKLDEMINDALRTEDARLLEQYSHEPGYFRQALGLFRGPLGWVMWVTFIAQLLTFAAAGVAVWRMFATSDVLTGLRWGVLAIVLVQVSTFLRGYMGTHFEANRLQRELQRLRLLLTHSRTGKRPNPSSEGDAP